MNTVIVGMAFTIKKGTKTDLEAWNASDRGP